MKHGIFIFVFLLSSLLVSQAQQAAFPGAEGFGMYTSGGRGGRVIKVTNLNDSGAGSLRAAIDATGPRIIVFEVSGTIALESRLLIENDDISIAGQTAPGDGICLKNYCVYITASNVIVRYMRFRMGNEAKQVDDAFGGQGSRNMIIDHCSMSWSIDECASFYANENFTMQWCLLTESLRNSFHYGSHGFGGIWGGDKATFHHNLLAHHSNRNPRFRGLKRNRETSAELVDLRNNVFYNYSGTCYGSEGGGSYNMVNNYYKSGPASKNPDKEMLNVNAATAEYAWLELEGEHGVFYVDGNYISANEKYSRDNWNGAVTWDAQTTLERVKSETEFERGNIRTEDPETAYERVLEYAGASLFRDTVDRRAVHDTRTGTATVMDGGNGSTNGYIDTQEAVGGWPVLKSLPAPQDSDNDGMPDSWERTHGLDLNDPSDGNGDRDNDLYTNIEEYINSLALSYFDTDPFIHISSPGKEELFENPKEEFSWSFPIKINFQTEKDFPMPEGYMADFGGEYCDKWHGYTFGWTEGYNPSIGVNDNETGVWKTYRLFENEGKTYSWGMKLPEGTYRVRLGLGGNAGIKVEGLEVEGQDGTDQKGEYSLDRVQVLDGQLTLSSMKGLKIYFIDIELLEPVKD